MNTRTSKISRLPKTIRHQLGLRIEDNQSGIEIVQWLNDQPDVQKILADQFNHSPVSEQNLSDWKQSGHQDWLRRQEAREAAAQLLNSADDLDLNDAGRQRQLIDNFAAVLAVEMSRLAMLLLQKEADPEKKWKLLCQINKELSQLRRDADRASRTRIREERWNADAERQKQEEIRRAKEAEKQQLINMLIEGEARGGNASFKFHRSENCEHKAELYYRLQCDLPTDNLINQIWPELDLQKIRVNKA